MTPLRNYLRSIIPIYSLDLKLEYGTEPYQYFISRNMPYNIKESVYLVIEKNNV